MTIKDISEALQGNKPPAKTVDGEPSTRSPETQTKQPRHTPLYHQHLQAGARMVDFSGWMMPVNYGSQLEEHHACRNDVVVFDVSHMVIVDITSDDPLLVGGYLQQLLANDVSKLTAVGDALYTCMLNDDGGVIDDLIVYLMADGNYRLVVNAGTGEKDIQWINASLPASAQLQRRGDLALLAVQGPNALKTLEPLLVNHAPAIALSELKRFQAVQVQELFIARTGYTGEDGVEIAMPADLVGDFWQELLDAGVIPAGLGARDTLRLEAGLSLYGNELDETATPLESGLSWTVAWKPADRLFCGRKALEQQRATVDDGGCRMLVGLELIGRAIPRTGHEVLLDGVHCGTVTSGTFSPTLKKSIALARIDPLQLKSGLADSGLPDIDDGQSILARECQVLIRGKPVAAKIVKPPFVSKTN